MKYTTIYQLPQGLSIDEYKKMPELTEAADALLAGKLIAFPTETVYGLGANACSENAVKNIFNAKGRPADNPLILHFGSIAQVIEMFPYVSDKAAILMTTFFPGPLTLILHNDMSNKITSYATANLTTVAIRVPSHPIASSLLQLANVPVAAPSANRSGLPSPTHASHVFDDLGGKIDLILDHGPTPIGIESTVLDLSKDRPTLLRPGSITKEQIEAVIGSIDYNDIGDKDKPVAPGMKYRHYAPKGTMVLIDAGSNIIQEHVTKAIEEGYKVGVLTTTENKSQYNADLVVSCGERAYPMTVIKSLYSSLRLFDKMNIEMIFCETFYGDALYESVMNRLIKAADGDIIVF